MNLPHSDFSHRVMSCIIYLFHNHPPLLRLPNLWEARISDRTAIALSHRMLINFTIHVFSLHLSQDDIQTPLNPRRKYYYIHGPLDLYIVIFDPMVQAAWWWCSITWGIKFMNTKAEECHHNGMHWKSRLVLDQMFQIRYWSHESD